MGADRTGATEARGKAWVALITRVNPAPGVVPTFYSLHSYLAGGGYIETSSTGRTLRSPAFGEWIRTGNRHSQLPNTPFVSVRTNNTSERHASFEISGFRRTVPSLPEYPQPTSSTRRASSLPQASEQRSRGDVWTWVSSPTSHEFRVRRQIDLEFETCVHLVLMQSAKIKNPSIHSRDAFRIGCVRTFLPAFPSLPSSAAFVFGVSGAPWPHSRSRSNLITIAPRTSLACNVWPTRKPFPFLKSVKKCKVESLSTASWSAFERECAAPRARRRRE